MPRLSSFATTSQRRKLVSTSTAFQTLLNAKPPWGQYSAASWNSTTNKLTDLTGQGRDATTTGVLSGCATGNGATASIAYVSGTTTSTITWPTGSIPATFTICTISRYVATNQQRIFTSVNNNWMHGHRSGAKGIAHYVTATNGWKTVEAGIGGVLTNWLNFCGTNNTSIASPNNILANTFAIGNANGGEGNLILGVNTTGYELGDFQISQVLIWDVILTSTEMATVSTALNTYLSTGALQ